MVGGCQKTVLLNSMGVLRTRTKKGYVFVIGEHIERWCGQKSVYHYAINS